ncbi:MAG: hypothetical protein A3E31_14700 [Candidatus Rokubacteria bacterium RIFCSPHIGHO2_12_FULL_73_22]|nr:MAG: hypothetical protein A3E31_14700 [Candidatus Rokubacteria bacterium RIFCSPHIGHO2_12_FULL_73_22]
MPGVRDATGLSFPAVSSAMDVLVELGIARELTGKRRNRLFVYDRTSPSSPRARKRRGAPEAQAGSATGA